MNAENAPKPTGKARSTGNPPRLKGAHPAEPARPKGPPKVPPKSPTIRTGVDSRPKGPPSIKTSETKPAAEFVPPIPKKTTPEGIQTPSTQKKVKTGTLQMPGLDPGSMPKPSMKNEALPPVNEPPPLAMDGPPPSRAEPPSAEQKFLDDIEENVPGSFSMAPLRKWQIGLAGVSLLLALSIYLNWHLWTSQTNIEEQTAKESPATVTASANKVEPLDSSDKKPESETHKTGMDSKVTAAEKPPVEPTDEESVKSDPDKAAPAPVEEETVSNPLMGTLSVIHRYPSFESVKVSVNTRFRGRSPLKLELPPGKYDITFSRDGKRSFRRAVIESGKTLEIYARISR